MGPASNLKPPLTMARQYGRHGRSPRWHRISVLLLLSALFASLARAEVDSDYLELVARGELEERANATYSFKFNETHLYFFEYKTEPTFRAVFFNMTQANYSALAPGYYFWSAISEKGSPCQYGCGPTIYDSFGNLVWYGNDTATQRTMRFHTCDYLGEEGKHLCFHDGEILRPSSNPGYIRFLDSTYTEIDTFGATGNLSLPDLHEVNTPRGYKGKILVQDTFEVQQMTLVNSSFHDTQVGWGLDCCLQEVDMETKEEIFQWCLEEHIPTAGRVFNYTEHPEYYRRILLGGLGTDKYQWDFWHINGVDKNPEGDYLISVRHLNTIIKIAGPNHPTEEPGTILWRLNGQHGDFDKKFGFSMQHAARFISSTEETETICFLDNASGRTSLNSSGKIVTVNKETGKAVLDYRYEIPTAKIANTAGNMQVIQGNNHVVMGWGSGGSLTEYSPDGQVLLHAESSYGHSAQAWKYPWVGHPKTQPKILSYSLHCMDSPVFAYVSWNGATEVTAWRFFTSDYADGPWNDRGTWNKTGFETQARLSSAFHFYTYVEALDASGTVLGRSNSTTTFVPHQQLRENCTETGCEDLHYFDYEDKANRRNVCSNPFIRVASSNFFAILYEVLALAYVFCAVELVVWLLETLAMPFFAGFGAEQAPRAMAASSEQKYAPVAEGKEVDSAPND